MRILSPETYVGIRRAFSQAGIPIDRDKFVISTGNHACRLVCLDEFWLGPAPGAPDGKFARGESDEDDGRTPA